MSEWRHCKHFNRWCSVIVQTGCVTNKGFSLLEVVIVLALLMATIGIGLPAYNQIAVQKEEERFFQLLKNDIYFAQTEAYRSGLSVSVMFREVGRYDLVQNQFSPISSREFPDSVILQKTSNLSSIGYWSNGSVIASGTLRFLTSTGERTIVVHLGKGRVVFSG
ncbi:MULTISPECIES: type II secretion system protein [Planomicrobium]|uniref:type II secretion system protein n=1 Tax=Planomicrobium TaxID=162291 RepID=UPI0011AE68F1|nr:MULTISPECIES: type II secretion system protein [Planomicrobium]